MRRRMARGKKKTVIDTAHPHTIKKFELIEEYIKSWSQKLMLYENCNTLVFIDCMCNAGIYNDGTLTTSMRILKIFSRTKKTETSSSNLQKKSTSTPIWN